jgi:uncharacterized membrane protein YkgB
VIREMGETVETPANRGKTGIIGAVMVTAAAILVVAATVAAASAVVARAVVVTVAVVTVAVGIRTITVAVSAVGIGTSPARAMRCVRLAGSIRMVLVITRMAANAVSAGTIHSRFAKRKSKSRSWGKAF